jgi:hypothetical protein
MTLRIWIGWDSREDEAFQVCRHSILRHAADPPAIFPLKQAALRELGLYTRAPDRAATEFSLTRFLVPWLSGHEGWALFVDCDFLFTADVARLFDHVTPGRAVHVVQHAYTPVQSVKMDGQVQTAYPRKNWSSLMLFDCTHPAVRALTPPVVNAATPAYLHRFQWLDDAEIGALPLGWNFLEGEYPRPEKVPEAIHYTNGGPWFPEWAGVDYADLWLAERDRWRASA